jgi:hypothetical protein
LALQPVIQDKTSAGNNSIIDSARRLFMAAQHIGLNRASQSANVTRS